MKPRNNFFFYIIILFALGLRIASVPTANMSYFILALVALSGTQGAIQALAICWFFNLISPGIAAPASLGGIGGYVIILAAVVSVFVRYRASQYQPAQKRIFSLTLAMGLFFFLHSLFFSVVTDVSLLKVVSWTVTTLTLLAAWGSLTAVQSEQLIRQLFNLLTLVMLVSLPLAALPLGYIRNQTGFQGILSHPQAYGTAMALLGVWAVMGVLTSSRPPWKTIIVVCICTWSVFMSEARTGGLAMVGGVIASIVASSILSRQPVAKLFPGMRSGRVILLASGALLMSIAFATTLSSTVGSFVSKRASTVNIFDAYEQSRGGLIDTMVVNIEKRPFTGIGFGIGSIPEEMVITRDRNFNLPLSAPIEKGVMLIAVVEEVGVFGFLFVLLWLWSIFRRALRKGGMAVGLFFTIILLNFGEAMMFSVSGMGLLPLLLLCWAAFGNNLSRESSGA